MTEIKYRDIRISKLSNKLLKKIEKDPSEWVQIEYAEIVDDPFDRINTHLNLSKKKLLLASSKSIAAYSKAVYKLIGYCITYNIAPDDFDKLVFSPHFRKIYQHKIRKKRILVTFLEQSCKKLPGLKSYIDEISVEGKSFAYDPKLKARFLDARHKFEKLFKQSREQT